MTTIELDLWEFVACDYCGAAAGDWCITATGRSRRSSHACRIAYWDDDPAVGRKRR